MNILKQSGYACPGDDCSSGIQKSGFNSQGDFRIEQITAAGKVKRAWNLRNWFVKSVRFGDLAYDSDDFVNVEFTLGYDCAILEGANPQ